MCVIDIVLALFILLFDCFCWMLFCGVVVCIPALRGGILVCTLFSCVYYLYPWILFCVYMYCTY